MACDEDTPPPGLRQLADRPIATTRGRFDDLALAGDAGGRWAVWSDRTGTFVRPLEADGTPRGAARRIGDRCPGGVDATTHGRAILVACVRPGGGPRDGGPERARDGGHAFLTRVDRRGQREVALGRAGRDSTGVALVIQGDVAHVAWHDGTPGAWRIRAATVRFGSDDAPRRQRAWAVSDGERAAEAPALAQGDGTPVEAWMETWVEHGAPHGRVMARRGDEPAREVEAVHWAHPLPLLERTDDGFVLGVRDSHEGDERPQLYLRRLGPDLAPRGEQVRMGRADGPGAARLIPCDGTWMTVAPRSWNRERLVSVARVTPRLERGAKQHQVFQDGRAYTRVDAACNDGHLLLLVGERGATVRTKAHLRVLSLDVP